MLEVGFELVSLIFVAVLALLELLGWEMVAYQMNTWYFLCLVGIVFLSVIILFVYLIKSKRISIKRNLNIYTYALWIGIVFTIVMLCLFYRSDADDSFYVSNVALFAESDVINPYDSSFGVPGTSTVSMYDFQIWESFLAVFARIFGINAAALCHGILPSLLLIVSMSAYCFLGKVLLEDDSKAKLFAFIVLVLNLLGGYSRHSNGRFLLSRLWQGKSVYLHVVLPVLIGIALSKRLRASKLYPWLLAGCMLAGVALNPTSMYLLGFQLLFMLIALTVVDKNIKTIFSIVPSFLVIAYFTGRIWLRTRNNVGQIENASVVGKNFVWENFKDFIGSESGWIYLILFVIAAIFIAMLGSKEAKVMSIHVPILFFVFIGNGITGPYVAKHITMAPTYWRVFWLIPIEITLAYAYIRFSELLIKNQKLKMVGMLVLAISLVIPGKYVFTKEYNFVRLENIEGLPSEVLEVGDYIESAINDGSGNVVLGNEKYSTTLRQVYTDIELICSRHQYVLDVFYYKGYGTDAYDRTCMWDYVHGTMELETERLEQLLNDYKVSWIVLDEGRTKEISELEKLGFVKCLCVNGDVLLTR